VQLSISAAGAGSARPSAEQQRTMAELLERADRPWHAFIAYYKLHKDTKDARVLVHIYNVLLPQLRQRYVLLQGPPRTTAPATAPTPASRQPLALFERLFGSLRP
jgi:hypothetical protein